MKVRSTLFTLLALSILCFSTSTAKADTYLYTINGVDFITTAMVAGNGTCYQEFPTNGWAEDDQPDETHFIVRCRDTTTNEILATLVYVWANPPGPTQY